MNEKDIVRQRILTLAGLSDGPNGPFGSSGGDVAARLVDGWAAERRLLQRVLDETKGDDVQATIQMWHDRTTAFLDKAEPGKGEWRDRDGNRWVAADVLRILDDLRNRIGTWRAESAPPPAPANADAARAARALELAALRESLGEDAAVLEDALEEALDDEDEDDEDDHDPMIDPR
ncbi:MAG: hypothetical protein ABI780_00665 [Ardenticatenales bacterium]